MSFDEDAKKWDLSPRRQALAEAVSKAILEKFEFKSSYRLLDVGAGTGLLSRRLMPHVTSITGVDSSKSMLEKFEKLGKKAKAKNCDILSFECESKFDAIVSSMTMHHIKNIEALFCKLHSLLKAEGFIALADLAPEDGSFHEQNNSGVYHLGFGEKELLFYAQKAGFNKCEYRIVHTLEKEKKYDIFLFTASL